MDALKPCPLCGGPALLEFDQIETGSMPIARVICRGGCCANPWAPIDRHARITVELRRHQEQAREMAIARWNTRAA
jgi:hypothetical protein